MAGGAAELPRKYDELSSKGIPTSVGTFFIFLKGSSYRINPTRFGALRKICYAFFIFGTLAPHFPRKFNAASKLTAILL
jgi:hypothetical protein